MKTILIAAVIVFGLAGSVVAQKKDTFMGTMVIGEITGTNADTREITISYPGKQGTETFSGFLADGYKVKMKDGSTREVQMSDITPGMRVKVLYKTKHENVGGQKKDINRIFAIESLGKDEFSRMRSQLNIDPSTPVVLSQDAQLPSVSPLKVFVAIGFDDVRPSMTDWITKWNAKHAEASDKLELVSDYDRADVLMVVANGSDTQVATMPTEINYGDTVIRAKWSQATFYLALKDPEGLKVLWMSVSPILLNDDNVALSSSRGLITSELESA
jgi:hypothetical protein